MVERDGQFFATHFFINSNFCLLIGLYIGTYVHINFLRSFCSSMLSEAPFDWLLYEIGTQQTCSCKYVCSWSKVLPSMFENIFEKVTRQRIPFGVMSQGGTKMSRIFSQTMSCDHACAHANVRCAVAHVRSKRSSEFLLES